MNLKEAFQAQNKISELMSYITNYLSDSDNVMTVTEKHLRSKSLKGQTDETVDVSKKSEENFNVEDLIKIWWDLLTERENISQAIGKAKTKMDFNIDAAVDSNKHRRNFLTVLERLAAKKSSHELQKGEGKAYVFNNEGNQTPYYYDIDLIQTIDYDRNKIRGLVKKIYADAEKVSMQIDEAMLNTQVDYVLKFDLSGEEVLIIEEMLEK